MTDESLITKSQVVEDTPGSPDGSDPLFAGFVRSEERFPDRPAVEVAGEELSYRELGARARQLAATLVAHTPAGGSPLVGVFAYRSATAFAGVLGALLRGYGYVALNQRFPVERTRGMLERSDVRAVIVDATSAEQLDDVLTGVSQQLLLVLPEHDDVADVASRFPQHIVLGAGDLVSVEDWRRPDVDPSAVAYIMFTSGSTGVPKGVTVAHRTVRSYLDVMTEHWGVDEHDRLSQMFDMTFDLSVSDMFVAWERGACVCCPTVQQLVLPKPFIHAARLSIWYSVPSTAALMRRFGMLKPGEYPHLRLVLACGEALPVEIAAAWADAAPNAVVQNMYGPTEATITCTGYVFDPQRTPAESELGTVPIGSFFPGNDGVVLDPDQREVAPGEVGELYLSGRQLALGYWRDEEKTNAAFVVVPGREGVHYRTGDRVRRPVGDAPMTYLGRLDFQVKINGFRVELGEIEAVLRQESGLDAVVVIAWPRTASSYSGVVAFVGGGALDTEELRARAAERLPVFMVPSEVYALEALPVNVNGKFDRRALEERLERGEA